MNKPRHALWRGQSSADPGPACCRRFATSMRKVERARRGAAVMQSRLRRERRATRRTSMQDMPPMAALPTILAAGPVAGRAVANTVRSLRWPCAAACTPTTTPMPAALPSFAPVDLLLRTHDPAEPGDPAAGATGHRGRRRLRRAAHEARTDRAGESKFQADQKTQVIAARGRGHDRPRRHDVPVHRAGPQPAAGHAGVLSRLQIPYLKVAILDRHLFTQKAHPRSVARPDGPGLHRLVGGIRS